MSDLRADGHAAIDWAADYLDRVGELPVLAQVAPGEIRERLPAHPPEDPEPFSAVLRDIDEIIVPGTTHWQHPRYFAYFAAASAPPAILGELIAATLNSVAFLWRTAPASTELEGLVADWVAELIGLPSGWHGHIEDSASTSTFAAAIAARRATGREQLVCSEQAHSSVAKAGQMLGMTVRTVPTDDGFRLDPSQLGDLGEAAMVIATVGTTASTSVDPVPAIADACERAGAWLHVDAAYAGSAMVCPELRESFAGVERADSLVLNPHKWMLVGNDCSLLYSRRPDDLRAAFSLVPEYLRTPDAEDALSLSEYGPALGRASARSSSGRCCAATAAPASRRTSDRESRSLSASTRSSPPSRAGRSARRARSRSSASARRATRTATGSCCVASTRPARSSSPTRSSAGATCCAWRSAGCSPARMTSTAHGQPCAGPSQSSSAAAPS